MAKRITVSTKDELYNLEDSIKAAAAVTAASLALALKAGDGLGFLRRAKFLKAGCDPLQSERPLNLIEQINQSFTYLVSIRAAEVLLDRHPDHAPYTLNLGTNPGSDLVSADGRVAAEVFAATTPESNSKLKKDVAKIRTTNAEIKYVFFYAETCRREYAEPDVHIIRLQLERPRGEGL